MIANHVAVIIPIYKEKPDKYELISLRQCCKVLGNYPIRFVAQVHLKTTFYENICNDVKDLWIERFDNQFFENIHGYNSLLLSLEFYKRFKDFEYILLYQLDAWVFSDVLEYWCNAGYDYIGAPWFEGWHDATSKSKILGVGNGGFSLRNVTSILNQIKILKQLQVIYKYNKYNWKSLLTRIPTLIVDVMRYNSFTPAYRLTYGQEDYFWCIDMQNLYNEYINNKSFVAKLFKLLPIQKLKIADITTAMKFSMECQPARLFALNNNSLPFGCHAWPKYDIEFWRPFIISAGYELP